LKRRKLESIRTADSFGPRLLGLMGKREWPAGLKGLFFPHCRSLHTWFTFLKPDLVFMDKNRKILKLVLSAGSWRFYFGPSDCRHCLELPEGVVRRQRLKVGMMIYF